MWYFLSEGVPTLSGKSGRFGALKNGCGKCRGESYKSVEGARGKVVGFSLSGEEGVNFVFSSHFFRQL